MTSTSVSRPSPQEFADALFEANPALAKMLLDHLEDKFNNDPKPDPQEDAKEDSEEDEGSCTCEACVSHADDPDSNKCENCEDVLHDWVGMYCLINTDGEEANFCWTCWQDNKKEMKADGWRDQNADENEPSSDEDDECEECENCQASFPSRLGVIDESTDALLLCPKCYNE